MQIIDKCELFCYIRKGKHKQREDLYGHKRIDDFLSLKGNLFPEDKIFIIRERLFEISNKKAELLQKIEFNNPKDILFNSILFGIFGVDRFMLEDKKIGLLKLFTLGGCGIWALADIFTAIKRTKELNYLILMQTLNTHHK